MPELLTMASCRKDLKGISAESHLLSSWQPNLVKGLNWTELYCQGDLNAEEEETFPSLFFHKWSPFPGPPILFRPVLLDFLFLGWSWKRGTTLLQYLWSLSEAIGGGGGDGLSFLVMNLGECLSIHSVPAFFFFFFLNCKSARVN